MLSSFHASWRLILSDDDLEFLWFNRGMTSIAATWKSRGLMVFCVLRPRTEGIVRAEPDEGDKQQV